MHHESDNYEIIESAENFSTWSEKEFIDDDQRNAVLNAAVLIVPTIGFKESQPPTFPPGTEEFLMYLKKEMPAEFPVEICISDTNFATLSLNSDYKRLGKIVIKKAVIPIFVTAFSAYIVYKITTEQEAKPQVTIINNITNITATPIQPIKKPAAQKKQTPHKYQDASKVTFTIAVVDSAGKSVEYHYTGPVDGVKTVTDELKKTFMDDPK